MNMSLLHGNLCVVASTCSFYYGFSKMLLNISDVFYCEAVFMSIFFHITLVIIASITLCVDVPGYSG